MTDQEREAVARTCATPGWRVVVKEVQDLVESYKQEAFNCKDEKEVLEHWRRSQVAQEMFDSFLDPLVRYRLPDSN